VKTGLRRLLDAGLRRARDRGRKAVIRALQLTGASVAAYLVADLIFPGSRPLIAPLTAMLVVQVSLYHTLTVGLQRVGSVVAGVVLAVLFATFIQFSWWSLGALIAASILIGQLLRLREQLLEVPISAMLVMSVGGAEGPAANRITETLVGAAVGIGYNVLLPGRVKSDTAGAAVERFAFDMAKVMERMADEVCEGVTVDNARRWLDETRRLAGKVARADRAIVEAQESRKLNVRAIGTVDVVPSLRNGLDALEHCTVALRGVGRSVLDQMQSAGDEPDRVYPAKARDAFAVLLRDLARAVTAYGRLVRAEADNLTSTDQELAEALNTVRDARSRLTELLMIDPRTDRQLWELNGSVLANFDRILREIDIEELGRQRQLLRERWEQRPAAAVAVDRLRTTSREVAARPLRWRRGGRSTGPDS
jgi:Aromatic acid exporter family member 1